MQTESKQHINDNLSGSSSFKNSLSSFFKPIIQPKLTVNQPNDIYEQEADAVADRIMRMPMNKNKNENTFFKPSDINPIQRKCAECEEEEEKLQKKLHRKENSNIQPEVTAELKDFTGSLNSGGKELPNNVRSFFEPRFGYDFSNVRIHNDTDAAKSAQSINALAYTSGNNIVFNQNQYSPETDRGKNLLAHELTHVVQQKGPGNISRRIPDTAQKEPPVGAIEKESSHVCNLSETETIFNAASEAKTWLTSSISALDTYISNPGNSPAKDSLERNFHASDKKTAERVKKILVVVQQRMLPNTVMGIECHGFEDTSCKDPLAYVPFSGASKVIFCPRFWSNDGRTGAEILIHEIAHTNPDIDIGDQSYIWTRIYKFQSTTEALLNADSYSSFCFEIAQGKVHPTPPTEDTITGCSPENKGTLDTIFANIEIENIHFLNVLSMNKELGGVWETFVMASQVDHDKHPERRKTATEAVRKVYQKIKKSKQDIICKDPVPSGGRVAISENKYIFIYPEFFKLGSEDAESDIYSALLMVWGEMKDYSFANLLTILSNAVTRNYFAKPKESEAEKIDFL